MPLNIAHILNCQRPQQSRARPRRAKKLAPNRAARADEILYRRDLERLVKEMRFRVETELFGILEHLEPQYHRHPQDTEDAAPNDLDRAMQGIEQSFTQLEAYAESKAAGMVERMDRKHRIKFFNQLKRQVGVDLAGVVEVEGLNTVLEGAVRQNVELIKTLSKDYFSELRTLVHQNTIGGRTSAVAIQKKILAMGAKSMAHAKFIARDQTAKLNSAINTERNLSLGIEEYEWRATGGKAGDGRTRPSHRSKHGTVFRFDSPPSDTGHPGEDFQCRCTARSIIPAA